MNTTNTHIRITQAAWAALLAHHRRPDAIEHASIALGKTLHLRGQRVVLIDAPGLALLDGDDCVRQSAGAVQVRPEVTRRLMWWFAQSGYEAFVSIHDHWFSARGTSFSGIDDADDIRQDRYLRGPFSAALNGQHFGRQREITHLSVVFDQGSFDARVIDTRLGRRTFCPVASLSVIGDRYVRLTPNSASTPENRADETLRRHDDFIAPQTRQLIGTLHVGLVGCGGLGPLLAENLMRAGVRRFSLFDPDTLDTTNLNRWLGGRRSDIGKSKADLLAARLRECEPTVKVAAHAVDVLEGRHAANAGIADLLILAVDNDAARLWGNRVASACLQPLFDLGVRVRTRPHTDFLSRIVPVVPGSTACLECSVLGLLDSLDIAKALDGITSAARRSAGYVMDAEAAAPSVMGLNTKVVGEAALAILDYLSGWRKGPPQASKWTWSTATTVMIQQESHRPGAGCLACGISGLARGLDADIPRRRDRQSASRLLQAVFETTKD